MLAPDPRFELIDAMDGRDFERTVADLLELLGYDEVELTPHYDKAPTLSRCGTAFALRFRSSDGRTRLASTPSAS
jgi:hypothetical protein